MCEKCARTLIDTTATLVAENNCNQNVQSASTKVGIGNTEEAVEMKENINPKNSSKNLAEVRAHMQWTLLKKPPAHLTKKQKLLVLLEM